MPAALGLQAQSITYWIRLWDKYCKMRYGKENGRKDTQHYRATFPILECKTRDEEED